MKTNKYKYLILIAISILQFGCSNRPMSMAGFMSNSNTFYTDVQVTKGTLIDTTIENKNSFDYVSYKELPINITASTTYNTQIPGIKIGGSLGINGLSLDAGYLNDYVGMMAWINAQIGKPCYGSQIAIRILNSTSNGFGPVIYYSKNEVVKTEGEQLSFGPVDFDRGYSYNEVGAGLYYLHQLNDKKAIYVDFKVGKNTDINTYRVYFDVSYAVNY